MRGEGNRQGELFCVVDWEELIPEDHPLLAIKAEADLLLRQLDARFDAAYAHTGRPSIPPEQLIKALLLQALFSIRSERQLCEQIRYNLLFKRFLDLKPGDPSWHPTVFTKNRDRMADHGLLKEFFESSVVSGISKKAASSEHFSVDGTLIQALASMKSFQPKNKEGDHEDKPSAGAGGSNRWVDWKGEKRSNETHASTTDPEARLARKGDGQGAMLAHSAHVLMENRNALVMGISVTEANGTAEREAALEMVASAKESGLVEPKTVGLDKGYDVGKFLHQMESDQGVIPHVAVRNEVIRAKDDAGQARRRARRRSRSSGYSLSQRCRMLIEPVIGWLKGVAGLKRTRFVGRWKTQLYAWAAAAAYNLLRMTNLDRLAALTQEEAEGHA